MDSPKITIEASDTPDQSIVLNGNSMKKDGKCCESKKLLHALKAENGSLSVKLLELEEKYLAMMETIQNQNVSLTAEVQEIKT